MDKKMHKILNDLKKESEQTRPEIKKIYQTAILALTKTQSLSREINILNGQLSNSFNLMEKLKSSSAKIEAEIDKKVTNKSDSNLLIASNDTINLILYATKNNMDIIKDIFKISVPLMEIVEVIIYKGDNKKMQKAIVSLSKTGLGIIPGVGAAFSILFEIGNQYTIYNNKDLHKASSRLDEVEILSTLLNYWNLIAEDFIKEEKRVIKELQNTINHVSDRQKDIKQSLSDYLEKGELNLVIRELP